MVDLDSILKSLGDIVFLVDSDLILCKYWGGDTTVLGIPLNLFLGKDIGQILPDNLGISIREKIREGFQTQQNDDSVYQFPKDKDKWYRIKLNLIASLGEFGKKYMLLIIGDCTTEMELKAQKRIFKGIISQNWDAITFANLEGIIQYINPATNRLYGYQDQELLGQHLKVLTSEHDNNIDGIINTIIETGIWVGEMLHTRQDKTTFEAFLSVQLIRNNAGMPIGYVSHSKDISDEKETANKLKKIIEERETLLKEIHHRVKNNLQVITSLLSLQANTIDNEKTKSIFQQSQYRINAMAAIHETLYQSDDFLTIGYDQYMKALANYLVYSIRGKDQDIKLTIDADKVNLNIDTAIPLGLLINEIVTNALKYGLKNETTGEIYMNLKLVDYPNYLLRIGDNGIGFSDDINYKTTNSLGLKLICNLVKQLKGNITKDGTRKGTHYSINFQEVI